MVSRPFLTSRCSIWARTLADVVWALSCSVVVTMPLAGRRTWPVMKVRSTDSATPTPGRGERRGEEGRDKGKAGRGEENGADAKEGRQMNDEMCC